MTNGLLMGLATVLAIIVGPVIAVLITRYLDNYRAEKARKLEIFRTLMRTRRLQMHSDHVGALNLVEVEFIDHQDVIQAWKAYLANLGEDFPPAEDRERFMMAAQKREALLTTLIDKIAKVLGIRVAQLDILGGNYVPRGWGDDEWENRWVRSSVLNVLLGRTPILIQVHEPGPDDDSSLPPLDHR